MRKIIPHITKFMLIAVVTTVMSPDYSFSKTKNEDSWQTRESLALKLIAEQRNILNLSKELTAVSDVVNETRDFELFPSQVTGLNDEKLLILDRNIEKLYKKRDLIDQRLKDLNNPLRDAVSILREMVTGEPVESMFKVLEKGDLNRISLMTDIKHQTDSLWKNIDTLLLSTMRNMSIPVETRNSTNITNTGLVSNVNSNQSLIFYDKMNHIKDSLIVRANTSSVKEMYKVEIHRVKRYINERKLNLALKAIQSLNTLYYHRLDTEELTVLSARVQFLLGDYSSALENTNKITDDVENKEIKLLLKIQSLYALKNYDSIWSEGMRSDYLSLKGEKRNLFLWIVMESGLTLRKKDNFVKLASYTEKYCAYSLHCMHSLARSYVQNGDISTALSVLEDALKYRIYSKDDEIAENEIRIDIAELNYELGNYKKSLSLYYILLNDQRDFDRALFGIIWCYVKLDMTDKAETSLRKLINQAPESPLAAEGILLLGERYIKKAKFEWNKVTYLSKEEDRLGHLLEKLHHQVKTDTSKTSSEKYDYAEHELNELLTRLHHEPRCNYDTIGSFYDDAVRVCNLIKNHYSTGSFQDFSFSQKREKILHLLDSIALEMKYGDINNIDSLSVSNARLNRQKIKNVVYETEIFATDAMLDRYHWEREYIDWQKTILKQKEQTFDKSLISIKDSIGIKEINFQKQLLQKGLDTLLLKEEKIQERYFESLSKQIAFMNSLALNDTDAAYFEYHLGELYYSKENTEYTESYEKYEKNMTIFELSLADFRDGKALVRPVEPVRPVLNHEKSMNEYRRIIKNYPSTQYAASAHYSLAWCFNDLAIFDSAFSHMDILANNYPQSPHAPQAWMYCGEYLFDKGQLEKAISCYQWVMRYPESEWFDEALYKLAWSQYRLSNPEKAISSFLALVDLGQNGTSGALLEKESMDYIAISFSETDMTGERGLQRATVFAKKLGDPLQGSRILHRLATVYRDQGRYDMAKKTYKTLLKMYPNYKNSPMVEAEYLAVLDRELQSNESNAMKVAFFKKYNRQGVWSGLQPDPKVRELADSISEKMLYDASIGFHQFALQKNDGAAYTSALNAYKNYITVYPTSPHANECHYNLAEIQFSLGNYYEAAEEYMAVSKRYPDSKYRETAAWNAIVASQNLLKNENAVQRE